MQAGVVFAEAPKFGLDLDGKEVRVKAGEPLDLNIPMVGTPTPEVKWTKEDKPVIGVESDDVHTRLFIQSSKRSGTFLVLLAAFHLVKCVLDDYSSGTIGFWRGQIEKL